MVVALVVCAGFLCAALGAGGPAALWVRPGFSGGVRLALGTGVLSAGCAGAGFAGLYDARMLPAAAGLLAIRGAMGLRAHRAVLTDRIIRLRAGLPRAAAAAVALTAVLWLALISIPGTIEDPLVYHWAAPGEFLKGHRIVARPMHHQWHQPLGVETLFGLGLAAGGVPGLRGVNLGLLFAALAATLAAARALGLGAFAATACGALALSPAVTGHVWPAKSDLGGLLYATAAVAASLECPVRSAPGGALFGVFAGLLAATKYTALYPLLGLAAWFACRRPDWPALPWLAGAGLLAGGIWPARNWLETGNPVFPFAAARFASLWWGPDCEARFHGYARAVSTPAPGGWPGWLQGWRGILGDAAALGAPLAALATAGVALALPRAAGAALLVTVTAWFALLDQRNPRFLLPVAGLAALGAAAAHRAVAGHAPRVARALVGAVFVAAVPGVVLHALELLPAHGWVWLAGRMPGARAEAESLTVLDGFRRWHGAARRGGTLLLAGESRAFGFRGRVLSTHVVVQPPVWRWAHESRDARRLAVAFRQAGITTIGYNVVQARFRHVFWDSGPAWTDDALARYRSFIRGWTTEVYRSPSLDQLNGMLYGLAVAPPGRPARTRPDTLLTVLPWTEGLSAEVVRTSLARDAERFRLVATELLRRIPDVGETIDQVAQGAFQLQLSQLSFSLSRLVSRSAYSGEFTDLSVAVGEALAGDTRRAFSSMRAHARLMRGFDAETRRAMAVLYCRWADDARRAGRRDRACALLDVARREQPDFPAVAALEGQLGCTPASRTDGALPGR